MDSSHFRYLIVCCVLALLLEGCMVWPTMTETMGYRPIEMSKSDQVFYPEATRPTLLSTDFGDAQRMAKESQILNPEASKNLDPVENLDGVAASKAMKRYRNSFDKPPFGAKGGGKK